mmetsp:Transcript_9675/g.20341  ORF Transcript_9675/g.20341 Transcript_9675/m.20341 type:complete len:223 (-) Transcript_9675:15-683(-)
MSRPALPDAGREGDAERHNRPHDGAYSVFTKARRVKLWDGPEPELGDSERRQKDAGRCRDEEERRRVARRLVRAEVERRVDQDDGGLDDERDGDRDARPLLPPVVVVGAGATEPPGHDAGRHKVYPVLEADREQGRGAGTDADDGRGGGRDERDDERNFAEPLRLLRLVLALREVGAALDLREPVVRRGDVWVAEAAHQQLKVVCIVYACAARRRRWHFSAC